MNTTIKAWFLDSPLPRIASAWKQNELSDYRHLYRGFLQEEARTPRIDGSSAELGASAIRMKRAKL